jgi:hypothetical protein
MSKRKEEDECGSIENGGRPDGTPQEEETAAAAETTAQADVPAALPSTLLVIEEHAKALQIPAPVFAAVRQMKGWAAGKKIEEAEFKEAVTAFLGAPIGGKK